MDNPTGQGLLAEIEATTSKLQRITASINGILDRRMSVGQCFEIIEKHIARTNEMVNDMRTKRDDSLMLPTRIAKLLHHFRFESSPHDSADDTIRRLTFVLTRFDEIVAERDALLKVREAADALAAKVDGMFKFGAALNGTHAGFVRDAVKAYKEARDETDS